MANSVVTVTDAMLNDSLLLLVGEDGTVTPDKETVESYLNSKTGATNIRLMHINKTDKKGIDISVDHLTYVPEVMNEVEITLHSDKTENCMEEIARNLYSFRLDHDYTTFSSPPRIEDAPQLEDLVQTLEDDISGHNDDGDSNKNLFPLILVEAEANVSKSSPEELISLEASSTISKTTPVVTPLKGKVKIISTEKQPMPKAVISKSSDRAKPKEKPKIVQQIEEEFNDDYANDEDFEDEDYDYQDDENDSDFQIEESTKQKIGRKNHASKKLQAGTKTTKSEKQSKGGTKSRIDTPRTREQKSRNAMKSNTQEITEETSKQEKLSEKSQDSFEKDKSLSANIADKKAQKKEKKTPKPIPNDFMLFSSPDIIRRVGKDPQTPNTPEISVNSSPAKISSENRSKSSSAEQSPQNLNKSNRLSLDSKTPEKQNIGKIEKSECKSKERRPASDKLRKYSTEEKSKCLNSDAKRDSNSNKASKPVILQNIQLSGSMEHLSMEPMPTPEDIRSIIMTEDVKSYTTSTLPLVQTSEISSTESIDPNIALDASSLDLDQSILDNINNDEISEDILYQVAQSLVGNTDLQNAIDKGLNEGNLVLDPAIQESIVPQTHNQTISETTQANNQKQPDSDIIKKGTQIVRPDGRIVVIPPIERPTTRSRNRNKIEEPPPPKTPIKPLDNEHVSGNELDSTDDETNQEEDESEDDPNKLWCICNQPHNNRFMICCDTCEEWYHGKCVNITKTMGQQMEEEGREWICLFCKDPSLKRPQAAARRIRKASRASTDSADSSKKIERNVVASQVTCIVCHKPARENSIYCSQSCILTHASGVDRVVVFEKSTGTMLSGNKAPSSANLEQWLKAHPTFEVYRSGGNIVTSKVQQKKKPQNLCQSKLKIVKNAENQGVSLEVRQKGVKVGVLKHLPKHEETTTLKSESKSPSLKPTGIKSEPVLTQKFYGKTAVTPGTKKSEPIPPKPLKTTTESTPTKPKLVQTTLKTTPSSASKEKLQPVKTPKVRQTDQQITTPQTNSKQQEDIRENVQKTLLEQLTNRIKLDGNFKLTEEELKDISTEIESQLYKCFGDTGQKYRNKYRSLIFNIKDTKNQTLWKRICEKSINAYQLVRLSPDDLASQELALWREREAKHSLDMIKKSELELLNCSRQYVLKTHKGEQVVDEDNRPGDKIDNTEVIRTLTEDQIPEGKDAKSDVNKDSQKKSSSKHSHRDKDRESKSSKDRITLKDHKKRRRSSSKDRDRSRRRSSSKERSSGKKERKRSRSRERRRKSSHKSSRHKKDSSHISSTDKLDKKSKEILEQLVDNKIVPPLEDRLWKHVPQEDVVPGPAESDSDHEPSSTVTIPTPPHNVEGDEGTQSLEVKIVTPSENKESEIERSMSPPLPRKQASEIWRGTISMIDVAHITITAHEVSGDCSDLGDQLPPNLDIVGRISLDTVWDYIGKMKCSNSKIISLIRLNAVNVVEKMPYLALYSYLSSRKRLGVVKSTNKAIKDFYVLPLAPQKPIPQALLPLNGPGFEESRPALLLGIIVRDRRKRNSLADPISSYASLTPKKSRVSTPPLPVGTPPIVIDAPTLVEPPRSYTPPSSVATPPPVNKDPRVKLIIPPPPSDKEVDDGDEPYSPEDSDPDNTLAVGQIFTEPPPIINANPMPPTTMPPFAFTSIIPGLDVGAPLPASTLEIQKQMEELNKKIEAQKSEIHSISKNIVSASTEIGQSALASIALPSNLQQILDSIKTISNEDTPVQSKPADPNLTIPLMLPKSFTRPLNTAVQPPSMPTGPKVDFPTNTIPLNLPIKTKLKINSPHSGDSPGLLSSLSEEELVKKAAEMLGEPITSPSVREKPKIAATNIAKRQKLEIDQSFDIEPPIPGVDN